MRTAGTTGAAGTAAIGRQGYHGFDSEAHVRQINFDALHLFLQILTHAERKTALLLSLIIIFWLIQSQCQAGAASTADSVNPDGFLFFARKESFKLLTGCFGQFNHIFLHIG